jgi:hypothetical protein
MHFGESLKYQLIVASSREMISDLVRVTSPPPGEALTAS